jgi:chromosome segregation ATPase
MADNIKFSDDEMKELQELQTSYQNKTIEFGQLRVQSILLKQQLSALEDQEAQVEVDYSNIQKKERDLVDQLNKKYGPGTLDPSTGTFTPIEQPPQKNE